VLVEILRNSVFDILFKEVYHWHNGLPLLDYDYVRSGKKEEGYEEFLRKYAEALSKSEEPAILNDFSQNFYAWCRAENQRTDADKEKEADSQKQAKGKKMTKKSKKKACNETCHNLNSGPRKYYGVVKTARVYLW